MLVEERSHVFLIFKDLLADLDHILGADCLGALDQRAIRVTVPWPAA